MKDFIIRIFIFCFLFFLFDKSFILLRNTLPKLEVDTRLEKIIKKQIRADILVFGSSRGARNIIASQIGDSLHTTSYNLSYPGGDVEFQYFLFKQILKYNKPKLILLSIDEGSEIAASNIVKYRYDRLYPLVKYKVILDELIRKKQKNKLLSNFFILHQLTKSSFDIQKKEENKFEHIMPCGSIPVTFQTSNFSKHFSYKQPPYYASKEFSYKRNCFLSIVKECNKNDIDLILVFPPNYHKFRDDFYHRIVSLAKNNGKCHIMRYNALENRFLNSDYFNDESHLIKKGAIIFTNEIIQYINQNNIIN